MNYDTFSVLYNASFDGMEIVWLQNVQMGHRKRL